MKRRRLGTLKVKWNKATKKYDLVLLEEHIVKEIINRLWWAKIRVHRVNCPVGGKVQPNEAGLPDLAGWLPSRRDVLGLVHRAVPLYIEVKRPSGVRRPEQVCFIEEAKKDGCIAFFAESWDDVVSNLKEAGVELIYNVGGKP